MNGDHIKNIKIKQKTTLLLMFMVPDWWIYGPS